MAVTIVAPARPEDDLTSNGSFAQSSLDARRPADYRPIFVVNGRFMSQRVTGVQRYALEIMRELDGLLCVSGCRAQLALPSDARCDLDLRWIETRKVTPFRGHAWEQITLPRNVDAPLLSLCNLAPLMASNSVVCIHDANVFLTSASYTTFFRQSYKFLQPRIARRACRVTSVSNHAARQVAAHLGILSSKIDVAPNGHEHALRWQPDRSSLKRMVEQSRRYVVVVGSLAPHKNIARVFSIAEALDHLGIDILVVGSNAGPFRGLRNAGAANIRFLGRVSDDDLACLLDHALCLLFPSKHEGFGLPVIEAMARHCPVIASDASCLPEVCGGAALLADPDVDEDWYIHIRRLAQSRDLCTELIGRGLANLHRYSWRTSASAYASIMEYYHA